MLQAVILTVLFLVGCGWLASTTVTDNLGAEKPRLTVVVSSAQFTQFLPIREQAGSHYCNNKVRQSRAGLFTAQTGENKCCLAFSFPEFVTHVEPLQKPTLSSSARGVTS